MSQPGFKQIQLRQSDYEAVLKLKQLLTPSYEKMGMNLTLGATVRLAVQAKLDEVEGAS